MGRWKALIPIALAMLIAVAGSLFIYNWMQEQISPRKVVQQVTQEQPETVKVAVAARNIAAGAKLGKEMLQTEEFIKKSLPGGYFSDPAQLEGRVALVPIKAREAIIEHRLASVDIKSGGVSAVISEGKRAVAIGGDKVIGISGFIHSGNRVDVLVTWEDPDSEEDVTKRILENVLVLATGTVMQETDNGETSPVDVYTLEVTAEEAEILTHSRNQGRIQLALRNPADNQPKLTEGATSRLAMDYLHQQAGLSRLAKNNPDPEPEQDSNPEPEAGFEPVDRAWTVVEVIQDNQVVERRF